jgi:pyrroline-5-carboxylate reductase
MDKVYEHLGIFSSGVFGTGHLGRALAEGLLDSGFQRTKLALVTEGRIAPELLHHSTLKVTMDTYAQAVTDEKRNAQNKVVKSLFLVFVGQ